MKRLTINRVARAYIRVNKKAYISLFAGILTAVFLAAATSLCAWGTIRGHEEQMAKRVGWMDMFLLGSDGPSDERLRNSGFFGEVGHVTVTATVENTSFCAGYYDETAARLMNRSAEEGRLPEKAGEIAAERSALLRLDKGSLNVGDELVLDMRPIRGAAERKAFTLVGILNEQTDYLDTHTDEEGMRFPALLVSADETYASGGTAEHRVLTYAPLITYNQVERNFPGGLSQAYGVSRETGEVVFYDSGWDRAANILNRVLVWTVLGSALMLSACVGITSAMETLLGRKTEDIGMLRAIGATRRQVRRIYGAEAWLLTATALPAGLLLGILTAWIVSRAAPDQVAFSLNIWLLVPILGLSALCVFVASRLPLYHASRQMPMSVLRDTALLRRAGKLRNHREFRPDRLIAGRRTRLHPLRQAGAACMIALTLLSTLLLGEITLGVNFEREELPAFRLYGEGSAEMNDPFSQYIPEEAISMAELGQISGIDGVREVRAVTQINANLLMDEVPDYLRTRTLTSMDDDGMEVVTRIGAHATQVYFGNDWLFMDEQEAADARARENWDWNAALNVQALDRMNSIRSRLGLTESIVPVRIYIADLDEEGLRRNVTDGSIDPEKLDSGEEVLLYAPTICVEKANGAGFSIDTLLLPDEARKRNCEMTVINDCFTAGTPLKLLEMTGTETAGWDELSAFGTEPDSDSRYGSMESVRAETAIGAVLSGEAEVNGNWMSDVALITTPKGAEALGLKLPGPEYAEVYLSGDPPAEKEAEIEEQIQWVAMRGWMTVQNQLKTNREYMAKKYREIVLFAALILLFFAVSVFMQVSAAARQIRSETRMIGTLRAVGANLKTLVGCYRLPVLICAGVALVPCLLIYAVQDIPALRLFTKYHPQIVIPALIVLAICVALACTEGIRARLAAVSRQSIVDNIREL